MPKKNTQPLILIKTKEGRGRAQLMQRKLKTAIQLPENLNPMKTVHTVHMLTGYNHIYAEYLHIFIQLGILTTLSLFYLNSSSNC